MKRYLRLYQRFIIFSLSEAMEFRMDFFFRIFMDMVYYGVNILLYLIIFNFTPVLGGWHRPEIMIFIGAFLIGDAFYMSFFANNCWWFPFYINRGDLDYYLVRPVSSLFILSTREFSLNSFINLLMASGILCWALLSYPQDFTWPKLSLFFVMLIAGILLRLFINLLFIFPVFWTQSERGFHNLLDSTLVLAERPHTIYQGLFKTLILSALPFGLLASYPCAFLFTPGIAWEYVAYQWLVLVLFFAFIRWLWGRCLRSYSSASS